MSLENLQLGMGLGKSLYQRVPTKYVPFDGVNLKDNTALLLLVGIFLLWRLDVL